MQAGMLVTIVVINSVCSRKAQADAWPLWTDKYSTCSNGFNEIKSQMSKYQTVLVNNVQQELEFSLRHACTSMAHHQCWRIIAARQTMSTELAPTGTNPAVNIEGTQLTIGQSAEGCSCDEAIHLLGHFDAMLGRQMCPGPETLQGINQQILHRHKTCLSNLHPSML